VDVYSRYAQARPVTERSAPNIFTNLQDTFFVVGVPERADHVWNGDGVNHQDCNYAPTKLSVGDRVRTKKIEEIFDRIDTVKFSRGVYLIRQKIGGSYLVRNTVTGEELTRRYKAEELQVVYGTEQQDDQDDQGSDQGNQGSNQNSDQGNSSYPDQQQLGNETRRQRRVQREQRRLEDTTGLNNLFDENQPRQRRPSLKKRGAGFRRTVGGALVLTP
jgi:hypothetical protein